MNTFNRELLSYNLPMGIKLINQFIYQSKVRLSLFVSFLFLICFQALIGFKYFDDYLIVFIFILFINDQFFKYKHPEKINLLNHERKTRMFMSAFFLALFSIPTILEILQVSPLKQLIFYKLAFIIWAQVFLLDAFKHYKETNSKQWLVFANTAMLFIVVGAFVL